MDLDYELRRFPPMRRPNTEETDDMGKPLGERCVAWIRDRLEEGVRDAHELWEGARERRLTQATFEIFEKQVRALAVQGAAAGRRAPDRSPASPPATAPEPREAALLRLLQTLEDAADTDRCEGCGSRLYSRLDAAGDVCDLCELVKAAGLRWTPPRWDENLQDGKDPTSPQGGTP